MSLVPRTTNAAEPLTRIGIRISLPRQIWQAQSAILLYLFMGCMDESWMHGMLVSPARRRIGLDVEVLRTCHPYALGTFNLRAKYVVH